LEPPHQSGGGVQTIGSAAAVIAQRREVLREKGIDIGHRVGTPGAGNNGAFERCGPLNAGRHAAEHSPEAAHTAAV